MQWPQACSLRTLFKEVPDDSLSTTRSDYLEGESVLTEKTLKTDNFREKQALLNVSYASLQWYIFNVKKDRKRLKINEMNEHIAHLFGTFEKLVLQVIWKLVFQLPDGQVFTNCIKISFFMPLLFWRVLFCRKLKFYSRFKKKLCCFYCSFEVLCVIFLYFWVI